MGRGGGWGWLKQTRMIYRHIRGGWERAGKVTSSRGKYCAVSVGGASAVVYLSRAPPRRLTPDEADTPLWPFSRCVSFADLKSAYLWVPGPFDRPPLSLVLSRIPGPTRTYTCIPPLKPPPHTREPADRNSSHGSRDSLVCTPEPAELDEMTTVIYDGTSDTTDVLVST